jgi:RNA polymerase sigma factor (sigma-70 family)
MTSSEGTVLARLREGDPRAFAELYDRHSAAVYRLAVSLMHDRDDARDVVQDTFLVLWRRRRTLQESVGESTLPWLLATGRNCCLNLRRSQRRRADLHLSEEEWASMPSGADPERADTVQLVLSEVAKLSAVDQKVARLCLVDGFPYDEAAAQLGMSRGAVSKRSQRIRARLRALRPGTEEGR